MKAVDFPEKNQDIGKDQEQYQTLPIKIVMNKQVPIWSKWKPSEEDLERLKKGGHIWVSQLTFGSPFQPSLVQTENPDFKKIDKEADKEVTELIQELSKQVDSGKVKLPPNELKQLREKMKEMKIPNIEDVKSEEVKADGKGDSKLRKLIPKKGGKNGTK